MGGRGIECAYYVPAGTYAGIIVTVFILLVQYLTTYIDEEAVPVWVVCWSSLLCTNRLRKGRRGAWSCWGVIRSRKMDGMVWYGFYRGFLPRENGRSQLD